MRGKIRRSEKLLRLHKLARKGISRKTLLTFGKECKDMAKETKAFCEMARHFSSKAQAEQFRHQASILLGKVEALDAKGKAFCKDNAGKHFPYTFDARTKALSGTHIEMNFFERHEYALHKCIHDLDGLLSHIAEMENFYD